jgi:hypothetical protein
MLHRYTFRNFCSFEEETLVDFQMPKTLRGPGVSEDRLSKILAVVGANGSGKTNLIKALTFINWFVSRSFRHAPEDLIPFEQHFFSTDPSSSFEVELFVGGETWRYVLELTLKRVLHEALYRLNPTNYFSYVFKRNWNGNSYDVDQQGFGMAPAEARKVRENASLISTAAQYNVPIALMMASLAVFSNVVQTGRVHLDFALLLEAAEVFRRDDSLQKQMASLLREWDLGLSGVVLRELEFRESGKAEAVKRHVPFGAHSDGEHVAERILDSESSGTQGAFVLLSHVLPALAAGGVAIIDELEADLHPRMLTPVMDLFLSPQTNPRNAQVIFTCHAAEILNLLQKPQVMLVEKDERGRSESWRLDSVQGVRKDDNLYAKYMAGAYGAVPRI